MTGESIGTGTTPLLKWAGGKRWLASALKPVVSAAACQRVVEPFAGGAALFFACQPQNGLLGDTNGDLIACYAVLRDCPADVSARLASLAIDQGTYDRLRHATPSSSIERAVRMLYLNRTAFGGLWRVNRVGQFNVPFGCKPETRLPDVAAITATAETLRRAILYIGDFSYGIQAANDGDVVYCDPPYTVAHNDNGFLRYNERIFSWSDQQRLARAVGALAFEGGRVVVSNAAHKDVLELYPPARFDRFIVRRDSMLAANPRFRGSRNEALIFSRAIASDSSDVEHLLSAGGLVVDGRVEN